MEAIDAANLHADAQACLRAWEKWKSDWSEARTLSFAEYCDLRNALEGDAREQVLSVQGRVRAKTAYLRWPVLS